MISSICSDTAEPNVNLSKCEIIWHTCICVVNNFVVSDKQVKHR